MDQLHRTRIDEGRSVIALQQHRMITRHGIEEYVADCAIVLDHRVEDQSSIRRLRVVKYRGTAHGTSEYPFLIVETGSSLFSWAFSS